MKQKELFIFSICVYIKLLTDIIKSIKQVSKKIKFKGQYKTNWTKEKIL